MDEIRADIRVAAVFEPGKAMKPVWFEWRRNRHMITEITYRWSHASGSDTFLHFSVSDGSALYELVYRAAAQTWTLENLETEQPL